MTEQKSPAKQTAGRRRTAKPPAKAVSAPGQARAVIVSPKPPSIVLGRPIEGQVAAIINELDLAINRGDKDGVTRGMRFEVLDPEGVEITDPENDRVLGEEVPIKIIVKVVRVEDEYSVARSDEVLPGTLGTFDSLFLASNLLKEGRPARQRTFRTDEAIFPRRLKEESSFVKRGDPVRQLLE